MFVSLLTQKFWRQLQIYDIYPIRKFWESVSTWLFWLFSQLDSTIAIIFWWVRHFHRKIQLKYSFQKMFSFFRKMAETVFTMHLFHYEPAYAYCIVNATNACWSMDFCLSKRKEKKNCILAIVQNAVKDLQANAKLYIPSTTINYKICIVYSWLWPLM